MNEMEKAMERATYTLRAVRQALVQGTNKVEFERKFHGKQVSPGVSVTVYIQQLRLAGNLDEDETSMRLRQAPHVLECV